MKRIVSLVLALSMVLSMFPVVLAGSGLKDIADTKYAAAVEALVELGVVAGYPDGTYLPENVVTRAELAKLLVVADGLVNAAEASKGLTPFADVNAFVNYWAAGYVNVAADYKIINGYPDGNFGPDKTVTYAEAVTMCLRVLGYSNVVEAKGTWPTNYIAKAQELKLVDGIDIKSFNDGATRGNIALLIWNMLQTKMWDVEGESEGDGLAYRATKPMVEIKFPDYELFEDVVVTDITVEDRKVTVELDGLVDEKGKEYADEFELAEGTDFLKLFGRTVTALYNEKDEVLATITPSADDKVVDGEIWDVVEDYTLTSTFETTKSGDKDAYLWGEDAEDATFATAVIGSKKTADYTTYFDATNTSIVKEIKESKKGDLTFKMTIDDTTTSRTVKEADIEDILVLIDGEWAYATDIEVGDIVTELVRSELYVVSRNVVEGEFEGITEEETKDDYKYVIEVDGEEYDAWFIEDVYEYDEDGDLVKTTDIDNVITKKDEDNKYIGQEVTLFLNFLGEVVEVRFGEVEELDSTTGNFYVLTNAPDALWTVSDKTGTAKYVELDGEDYESKVALPDGAKPGDVVYAKLDSKDRVKSMQLVGDDWYDGDSVSNSEYMAESGDSEITDKNYLDGHKVTNSTIVITITPIEGEKDGDITPIEGYEVTKSNGPDALEGIEDTLIVWEADDSVARAKFVFVWEDAKNTDKLVGIVEGYRYRNGVTSLIIDGEVYKVDVDSSLYPHEGDIVVFTEDEEDGITIIAVVSPEDANDGARVIEAVEPRDVIFSGSWGHQDLDALEAPLDKLEDYRTFLVDVDLDEDGDYEFTSWEEIDFEEVKLKEDDYVDFNDTLKMTVIFRGIEIL